jgi:hypothetical protein
MIDEFDSPNRRDEALNGPDFLISLGGEVFERLHFDFAATNEQRRTSYDSDNCLQTNETDLRDTDRLQVMPPGIGSVEDLLTAQTKTRRVNSTLQHRLCRSPKHSRSRRANTFKPVHRPFTHVWLPWVVMRPITCPGHRKQQASGDPVRVSLGSRGNPQKADISHGRSTKGIVELLYAALDVCFVECPSCFQAIPS